ncbi:MAG: AAA family ATPase, partial [Nitrososphaera sp.]|nr:AAA family ATPase [Nitrososphaera sp.]
MIKNARGNDIEAEPFAEGSKWRRWDLHVHTPASALANQFSDWESYVGALETAGTDISALGATDYCSIEGYKKLLEYRRAGRLAKFDLLIPGVEFRTHPETSDGKAINIHLLVSPDDPNHVMEIEQALAKLTFSYKDKEYACTKDELIRLGKAHDPKQTDEWGAFRNGVNQFKPDFDAFRKWYNNQGWLKAHSLIAIANGKDGAGGLSKDAGFSAAREELYRFAHLVFSGKPADQKYFLGEGSDSPAEVIQKNGSLKPCVHGCDAHKEEKLFEPTDKRYCWIKANPTFEGLRQIVHEPKTRVYIGPTPPQAVDESKVIKTVTMNGAAHWFPSPTVELNPGLVAIIGEKGSGKTALADLVAYATHAWHGEESSSSFIEKASSYLDDVEVNVTWGNGRKSSRNFISDVSDKLPEVRYLSQDFVEELCSQDTSGDALIREIEDVVFSHIDETERLETSSFEELRRLKTEHITSRRDTLRAQLSKLNSEIVRLENIIASRESKTKQLAQTKQDIDAIDKQLPTLQSTVDKTVAAQLNSEKDALLIKNKELGEANRRLNKIQTARAKIEDIRRTMELGYQALKAILEEVGLNEQELEGFKPKFDDAFDIPLLRKETELQTQIATLRGNPTKPIKNGTTIIDIQARIADLEKALAKDEKERERLLNLQKQKTKLQSEGDKVEKEIQDIDTVHRRELKTKQEARWQIYLGYFDLLLEEAKTLQELYKPLDDVLASDPTGAKAGFEFSVQRIPDFVSWLETGRALVDCRKNTPFRDRDLDKRIERGIAVAWREGNPQHIRAALERLIADIGTSTDTLEDILLSHATRIQFYDWLFSTEHVGLSYSLKYKGTDLSVLSPGTRGIVLLILYLEMDRQDRRPLIIDQPEGNLDSSSVYDSLVPYLRRAKAERQIILITHNPNLVVGADAEQVIVATMQKEQGDPHPTISYKTGALEDATGSDSIRESVCRFLEGGRQAFKVREN